jgi:hypothetical protein
MYNHKMKMLISKEILIIKKTNTIEIILINRNKNNINKSLNNLSNLFNQNK